MFSAVLLFLVSLLSCAPSLYSTESKVADIDLQTCVANFDVHTDKIIRTQDSRNMGAKYLNEMDLDSREECLRLCCETENCDVFVFEEKSTGSCYLFECGPPEDFKCKFTHHANYTSAVLAISRHMSNLENQIKLTKHEKDLTKLRSPEIHTVHDVKKQNIIETTITPTTTQPKQVVGITSKGNNENKEKERKCSRYQFECRSSGECIAIYNACDGIAQCADGSDEAPELNCPELSTTIRPPALNPVRTQVRYELNRPGDHQELSQYPQQYKASFLKQVPQVPHGQDFSSERDFIRPMPNVRDSEHQIPPSYENQQLSYQNVPVENANGWISRSSNPTGIGRNGPIPNMDNGAQLQKSQSRYGESGGHNYNVPFYGDTYQNSGDFQPPNWSNIRQADNSQPYSKNGYQPEVKTKSEPVNGNWQTQRQKLTEDQQKSHIDPPTPNNSPLHLKDQHDPQESEKMAQDLKSSKHTMITKKPTQPPKEKQAKPEDENVFKVEKDYVEVARYKTEEAEFEDGFAQTPGGAALSLTLGLFITCVMAILIACRLRVVRRRIRKGGKGYAHDADYLVNGMYL